MIGRSLLKIAMANQNFYEFLIKTSDDPSLWRKLEQAQSLSQFAAIAAESNCALNENDIMFGSQDILDLEDQELLEDQLSAASGSANPIAIPPAALRVAHATYRLGRANRWW